MRVNVRSWGNSAAVRIPASIMAAAGIAVDQNVEMIEHEGSIVITPARDELDLDALIAGITDENRHGELLSGPAVGREVW